MNRMDQKQRTTIDKLLARYLYSTCSSFTVVENKHFLILLKALRPAYNAPRRFKIGDTLLGNNSY